MTPQNEPVIHAFGLMIFQRWQIRQRGGFGFLQNRFGRSLQLTPAGPIQIRGVGDLPQQAPPFDDDAVDVSRADKVGHPACLLSGFL